MRGLRCLVALISLALPQNSTAQTIIDVLSGEHGTFARLAMTLPQGSGWSLRSVAQSQLTVIFDDPRIQLDLSRVYEKIDRRRIGALTAEGPVLDISINCLCDIDLSNSTPRLLVIDIRDRSSSADPPMRTRPRPRPPHMSAGQELSQRVGMRVASDTLTALGPQLQARDFSASRFEERLSAVAVPPHEDAPDTESSAAPPMTGAAGALAAVQHLAGASQMRAHLPPQEHHNSLLSCAELSRYFQAFDTARHHLSPDALVDIFSEDGRVDDEALALYSVSLLANGLGAEVTSLLSALPEAHAMAPLLGDLAALIDGERLPAETPLHVLNTCEGMAAHLGRIAESIGQEHAPNVPDDLSIAFFSLPVPVQTQLVFRIARHLPWNSPITTMARTELRKALSISQDDDIGAGLLREPVQSRLIRLSDEALALLVAEITQTDLLLAPIILYLVERTKLISDEKLRRELSDDMANHMILRQEFETAHKTIEQMATYLPYEAPAMLHHNLLRALVERGEDSEFVVQVFEMQPWAFATLPKSLASQLAMRLLDIELPDQAALFVEGPIPLPARPDMATAEAPDLRSAATDQAVTLPEGPSEILARSRALRDEISVLIGAGN